MENAAHGHLINMISGRMKRLADENLVSENVTIEQVKILHKISRNGGKASQKEIELAFGVRRSTVTSAMQILEKKGYIKRESNPGDSRSKLVYLTDVGEEKNIKLKSFIEELEAKLTSSLTKEESAMLKSLLLKVLNNF